MKILYANASSNKFDELIRNGLTRLGHEVAMVNYLTPSAHVQRAAAECDVALSAWADQALVSLAGKVKPKRLVTYLRSYEAFSPPLVNAVDWDQVDRIIFVAHHVRDYVIDTYPKLARIPRSVIHNGVDPVMFSTAKDENAEKRVLVLANLSHKKGMGLLAQAAHRLISAGYEVHVAGEWQEERFRQYYLSPGIQNMLREVKFLGRQKIGEDFFGPYGWILSTSPWEGCPWNVLEAMAGGCIPLVHGWPGAVCLFGSNSVWHTLDELMALLDNGQPLKDRAKEARKRIEERFTAERMVYELDAALKQTVDRVRVGFSVLSDRNHATSRIRGWWVMDALVDGFRKFRVVPIRAYAPMVANADVYVVSRAWGPAANQKIDSWRAKGCRIIYDAADFYAEAVETINKCDALICPTKMLAAKYGYEGVGVPCHVIPDMADPEFYIDPDRYIVNPDPAEEIAYFGTRGTLDNVEVIASLPEDMLPVIYGPPMEGPDGEPMRTYKGWHLREWKAATILDCLNPSMAVVLPDKEGEESYKSANKLLTAAMAGVPVVCGPRPAYVEIMEAASLQRFVATKPLEWLERLEEIAAFSAEERLDFVDRLRLATSRFQPWKIAEKWAKLLAMK